MAQERLSENRTSDPDRVRILFFGDSNTYGYDPSVIFGGRYSAEIRWTDRLSERLGETWEVLAYGLNGRCIPDLRYEKPYLDQMLENAGRIDLFAVMLGTNDVILTPYPDAERAVRRMDVFLDYLCEKRSFRVLLIAPPAMDRLAGTIPDQAVYVRETAALADQYKKLAGKHAALYINADAWGIGMAHDFVHFSEEGHRVFAENMKQQLESFRMEGQF